MSIAQPTLARSAALSLALPLLFCWSTPAMAESLGVDEIVKRANHAAYYQGQDGRATVDMTITDKNQRKRTRRMTILRRNETKADTDQQYYVYFHKPADVAKTVYIVHRHIDRDDDRWIYLPSLDLVKRIAASDTRSSFVGSDYFYEDISGRHLDADEHKLLKTTKNFYVVENTPKKPDAVEFSRYEMYVHKTTFLPTKVEYYDKQGRKHRVMTVHSVAKVQDLPTVTKLTMEDLRTGSTTTMEMSDVQYGLGLPKRVFGERYLRRPPTKHLQAKK